MKNTILLLSIAMIGIAGCKKEIKSLPEPTQTGANTFGAIVGGENWGPLKAGALPTLPVLEARFSADSSVFINARNFSRTPTETEMEIYLKNLRGPGVYPLNQLTGAYPGHSASYAYFLRRKITVEGEWITGPDATGQVQVTKIDWDARVISGTFSFTANATNGSGSLTVTDGRFDVKIQ
ncbi:MAG TPA: DUF6252 family protein [Flavisolibacter sp.]|nr:DUF6252 family protein [Flavisolibacter sp.]